MASLWHIRESAGRLVERISSCEILPVPCLPEDEVQRLESTTDLDALCEALTSSSREHLQKHVNIVWAEGCLRNPHGVLQSPRIHGSAQRILTWTTESIFPKDVSMLEHSAEKYQLQALAALRLISELYRLVPALKNDLKIFFIACYASFTDDRDPWTLLESREIATYLLDLHQQSWRMNGTNQSASVVSGLLDEIIRPVFSSYRTGVVTSQGRKRNEFTAASPDPSLSAICSKPLKDQRYTITILRWAFQLVDPDIIEDMFSLAIPPVLALLDDEDSSHNIAGCELLAVLLEKIPTELLRRTGLGDVFEESLMPFLSYLPPLTDERSSIELIGAAYSTLFKVSAARFPEPMEDAHYAVYDRIMRKGILYGYAHAGDHVKLMEALLHQLTVLIDIMGIRCVKHLRSIIPILDKHISDPFALSYIPLLNSSIKAMQVVILNAWPRVHHYSSDIFQALSICWSRLLEEGINDPEQMEFTKISIKEATKILIASLVNAPSAMNHINAVFESQPRLKDMRA